MSNLDKLKKTDWKSVDWQSELKQNISSIDSLKDYIDLSEDEEEVLREVVGQHPMNIPRYYLSLLNEYDTNDPIRKLALPSEDELIVAGSMGETTKDHL